MNIVFLYTELAGYSIACMKKAIELYPNTHITVIRWPINKEAPFQFDFEGIQVREKNEFNANELVDFVREQLPSIIVCSGWMDKEYVGICKQFKNKIPTVLALDNQWTGSVKQQIAKLVSPFLLKNKFSHVWVPGQKQFDYARKLGFKKNTIHKGFYSADVDLFSSYYKRLKSNDVSVFPKRMLYVGRYVEHKGIFDLWKAFIAIQNEVPNEWELWCVGTGDQWGNKLEHPQIKHLGFLQPTEMDEIIKETSIYVLPSHFEPWGVSLHEFVAAGYPVVCSDKVGSAEQFLQPYENGYSFPSGDVDRLKEVLLQVMNMDNATFASMSKKSLELAQTITPSVWAKTIIAIHQHD
jgi:glycosyltransferase involved in cell wall biosynthesis